VSELTDKGNDDYYVPEGYLFFLYDVQAGEQWIIINIRYMTGAEYISSSIILFVVAGAFIAIYVTQKKYNWFEKLAAKIPESWKEKLQKEPEEAMSELVISTNDEGKIIIKSKKENDENEED
jgi:hypothetical protein